MLKPWGSAARSLDVLPLIDRRELLVFGGGALLAAGAPALARAGPTAAQTPFTLGVASGDPAPDGFVIWTRLAPEPLAPDGRGGLGAPVPVLVLGDYIYEYSYPGDRAKGRTVRAHDRQDEVIDLAGYRDRYALNKTDPDLQDKQKFESDDRRPEGLRQQRRCARSHPNAKKMPSAAPTGAPADAVSQPVRWVTDARRPCAQSRDPTMNQPPRDKPSPTQYPLANCWLDPRAADSDTLHVDDPHA